MFWLFWTFWFRSKTSHPRVPTLALIDKSSPRESRSEFLPRTHPIHSNMSKNHVLAFLNFLIPVKNIAPSCANIGINWQKFAARITKWVFATNAPNTLQYVQKSCCGAFWTFWFRSKTSHLCWPIYTNIRINWQKFAARITKWFFATNAPNTLQYVQKSCFGFFELFDSGQKHRTLVCQHWH